MHVNAVPPGSDTEYTGFTLKAVPWYGWASLAIVGWALYQRQWVVAISALAGYFVVKAGMGRL